MGSPTHERLHTEFRELCSSNQDVAAFADRASDLVVITRDDLLQVLLRVRSHEGQRIAYDEALPKGSATLNDKTLTLEGAKEGEWRWKMVPLGKTHNEWSGVMESGTCDVSGTRAPGDFILEVRKHIGIAGLRRRAKPEQQ
ncbi:MAG: hypothetical protein HOG89_03695 [Candidatus Peribacter sp.]|jgi:hypothetical protein|nr:hypothetical protein [Candidatus Peribacter sp.]MBT4393072.1 hypothetical protein [Candidatus Peribacter sp.]MBT4600870.1 hypothetical protein [Candidatus Peribacter sp.]MBT5148999.1 hypothetical protein [Candidatus Peribacter sp.]MBT5638321.1 hypothetical protein [Candidatus Peribacter sp.]